MPQVSLYLNDTMMADLRTNAQLEKKSLSNYVSDLLASTKQDPYPASFWSTYGALKDATFTVPEDVEPVLDGPMPSFD